MDSFKQNRKKAREVFLNPSHHHSILTGNTGEVKFALLPQVNGKSDDYLMARWQESCSRTLPPPPYDALEYGKRLTFWFQGQPLQLFEGKQDPNIQKLHPTQPSEIFWQSRESFNIDDGSLSFSIKVENSYESEYVKFFVPIHNLLSRLYPLLGKACKPLKRWSVLIMSLESLKSSVYRHFGWVVSYRLTPRKIQIHESQYFRLDNEEPLPTTKQSDRRWATKFYGYYSHHFGSVSSTYDMSIDLEKLEVRYVHSTTFDCD